MIANLWVSPRASTKITPSSKTIFSKDRGSLIRMRTNISSFSWFFARGRAWYWLMVSLYFIIYISFVWWQRKTALVNARQCLVFFVSSPHKVLVIVMGHLNVVGIATKKSILANPELDFLKTIFLFFLIIWTYNGKYGFPLINKMINIFFLNIFQFGTYSSATSAVPRTKKHIKQINTLS